MLAALADHLWQSLLFCGLAALLTLAARAELAVARPWMWHACIAKFLCPFALIFAAGEWLGFPVAQPGESVPVSLTQAAIALTPCLSPVQSGDVSNALAVLCVLVLLLPTALCLRAALQAQRRESAVAATRIAPERDRSRRARLLLLFLGATLLTSCAIAMVSIPLLGGAISDRNRRQGWLLENAHVLRDAPVVMNIAAPGMGERLRIDVSADGVRIRNINIRELIAVSNGVSRFAVSTTQMYSADANPSQGSWLLTPRYDLQLRAAIREPREFDPYALRQRITRLLAERFGLEIEVNGKCQPPCGRWDHSRDDRPL